MATRFLQDFTNRLIREAFFAERHGAYNIPIGDLERELKQRDSIAKGQNVPTDEYEGRRAQGVQDRLAAGEQTAPPSGGQAMGMRATSPGDEKRIEDLTHTRRRPMIAPGVSDGSGRTVHPPVHGPIPSAPPTPPIPSGIGVGVGPGTVRGSEDAPTKPAGSGLRNFIPSRFGGSMSKRERSKKDTIAGSVLDDFRRRYSADNEFQTEQLTTTPGGTPGGGGGRQVGPGGPPQINPDNYAPRDRAPRRNPGKGKDFQDYYRGIGWGSDPKYGDEGWNENGYPVCYGSDCRSV